MADTYRPTLAFNPEDFKVKDLYGPGAVSQPPQRNAFIAGISAGIDDVQGTLGGALPAAISRAVGATGLASWFENYQRQQEAEARANGRPDLDTPFWREGGAGLSGALPWVAYQGMRSLASFAPDAALGVATAGTSLPATLAARTGGLAAAALGSMGRTAAASAVTNAAGSAAAKAAAGLTIGGIPSSIGQMYGQALERGDPTMADAAGAIALSPVYSALNAVGPAMFAGAVKKGASGGALKEAAKLAGKEAITEAPTEASQTALEMLFRPDLTLGQKANAIVDGGIAGFLIGGSYGAVGGVASSLRDLKGADPKNVSNDKLEQLVDDATGQTSFGGVAPARPNPMAQLSDTELRAALGDPEMDAGLRDMVRQQLSARAGEVPAQEPENISGLRAQAAAAQEAAKNSQDAPAASYALEQMRQALRNQPQQEDIEALRAQTADLVTRAKTDPSVAPVAAQAAARLRQLSTSQQGIDESPNQPGLFGSLPEQRRAEPVVAAAPGEPNAAQKRAMELAGNNRSNRFIESLSEENIKDDADLYNAVQDALKDRKSADSKTTQAIAQKLGVNRDLNAELEQAQADAERAWEVARRNPGQVKKAQELQAKAREIAAMAEVANQAVERRQAAAEAAATAKSLTPVVDENGQYAIPAMTPAPAAAQVEATPVAQSAAVEGQGELFPNMPATTRDGGQAPNPIQARALELSGNNTRTGFIEGLNPNLVRDDVDLYNAVEDALSGKGRKKSATDQSTMRIAQSLGIVDANGNERDLAKELSQLQAQTQAAWSKAARNPGAAAKAQQLQAQTRDVQNLLDMQTQAKQRRKDATYATSEMVTREQVRRQNVRADQMSAADAAFNARQEAAAQAAAAREATIPQPQLPAPQTPLALPNYADPVAIAEAQAAPAMSPVPQADVSKPPSRRQPTARPQAPIPDVITDAEITGTGALADALRAAQRKAQFVLAEQQREQQAYNNAILQRAEQQSTKLSVDAVSNNVNDIRAMGNRRTINGFNLLSEDQKTKILDEYFNNNPRELLIYVRNTPTAQARQFLAYAAGVDVAHFNRAPVPANDSQMQMSRAPGQETTGDVFLPVYKGEDGALVMSLTENGKPIYLGVTSDGKTDVRDINDRSLDRNGPYSPQLLAKLREQAAAHEANEMALAVNQGVFVGAQNNIVASDSVSADNIGMLQDWMEMLGLGNVKVFFADFKDLSNPNARERYGLYGPYRIGLAAQQFSNYNGVTSPMGEGHVIAIDFSKSPATVMEAIGHELGHIVQQRGFDTATESTRAAVMRGFAAWTEKNIGKDLADVIRSVRTPSSYRDAVAALSNLQTPEQTAKFRNYVTSFNEYFADNVARYLLANPKKPTTLVDRFFAQVAKLLRPLINLVNSGFTTTAAPDPAVKDFLDAMRAGAVIPNATTVPASFNALKLPDALSSAGLTPERLNEASKRLASTAKDVAGAVLGGKRQRSRQLRQAELYITSPGHIVEQYGGLFVYNGKDALRDKYNAQQSGTALAASMARLHSGNYEAWQRLQKASKSAANNQIELMALTALRINPTKTWSEHTWLQDQPNAAALKSKVDRANNLYRNLQSQAFPDGKTYASVYDDAVVNMEMLQYANVSMALRNLVAQDPELSKMLPSFAADPMEEYRAAVSTTITSPTPSRDFWKSYLKDRMTEVQQYLALQRGAVDSKSLTKQSQQQIVRRISPLEKQMQSINVALSVMEEAPYFHLGRYGEYFVAFKLATGEDGSVDPKAIKALQDDLGKNGFENVVIESDNLNPDVYIRVETPDASEKLYERVVELQRKGVVSDKQEPIRAKRGDENLNFAGQPEWLQRFIQNVTAAYEPSPDMSEAQKKQMLATKSRLVSTMQEMYLDMMPDTAINKVMVRREGVQGFEADMMRNFSWRMQVGINSLVNMSVAQKNSEAIITMRAAIKEARSNRENDNVYAMQDVLDEVLTRDQNRSVFLQRSFLDLLRATNHAYFLGMSPSYVGLQFTQLGVLLWPELSKRHGFVDSAKVIGKVTPLAFKVMRATFQEGKSLGAHRVTDAVINENVLERAGITGADAKFVLDAVAHGFIDIGGASREMGRAADGRMGDKWDTALRYASAFGYYSETMTRLIAALSARELHNSDTRSDKGNLMDYVRQTVEQSMFNYQTTNEARILSKNGIAGPITPLATAFYKYTASLLEKMYREIGRAFFNQARTEAEKTEARRFLVSHALAVATVSGTMGLPFASAFFRAAEKIADAFGDDGEEPADFKAAYRNMLADMFGKDAGEVIARGLPRAFGFDIASRAGEQDILPFTRLLADRRKWDEATKDWAVSAFGSPFSMVNNIISGGSDIANGDRMEGAKKLLPVALKGPLEAYNMAENGYVDKKGQALPMTAGASDIAYQMLGFTPSNKAEYNEARLNQIARRGEMTRMASDMRRQIAVAIERGDRDTARELMSQAANFDRQNPAFAVLPTLSSTLHSRARARALAEGLGTPLGVSPKDVVGQALTDYANY